MLPLSGIFGMANKLAYQIYRNCELLSFQAGQYIGEMCRYILMVPPRPEDKQHKVKFLFGNGMRSSIWQEFVERFNLENIFEFYGSTEGNANIGNQTDKKFLCLAYEYYKKYKINKFIVPF